MKNFWNQRYSTTEYAYGTEPNEYLKVKLNELHKNSKILFPAEGEGRNAVYAASLGYDVSAFDISRVGRKKALKLAESAGVDIEYRLGTFEDMKYDDESFDCIVMIYAHFPLIVKEKYYSLVSKLLKKDGLLIIEGFSKNHIEVNKGNASSCGPQVVEMLFSTEEFRSLFNDFKVDELKEEMIKLNEGQFHDGKASVVRFTGRKK